MKTATWRLGGWVGLFLTIIMALLCPGIGLADDPPPIPLVSYTSWGFDSTNWLTGRGNVPALATNLSQAADWASNALVMNTNVPAILEYRLVETNANTNLTCSAPSTLLFWFSPLWTSVDQGGSGPGNWAYLVCVGASNNPPAGLWAIYIDPAGTNLFVASQTNGSGGVICSTPISFASNEWHFVSLVCQTNNTLLFLDGVTVTNTSSVVTHLPPTNAAYCDRLFIGSDHTGTLQARGEFENMISLSMAIDPAVLTNFYNNVAALISDWEGEGEDGGMMTSSGLIPDGSLGSCVTGTNVYITNAVSTLTTTGMVFSFSVAGGTNGVNYDVFSTTNLVWCNSAGFTMIDLF